MKNFRKYIILSLAMIFTVLFVVSTNVNASSGLILTPGTSNTLLNNTTNTAVNNTTNTVVNNTTNTTNNVAVNNINDDADKDIPQTGENDIYIVAGIGALALAIGGFAFIKSRKYSI